MSKVRIPPVLRQHTNGATEVSVDGTNVGEILNGLVAEYPDTKDQLFAAGGELNRFVNVYLNDEDVRVLDGLETGVKDTDTVMILPAMAGGE